MAVFDNANRDETFRGTAAQYDQVDYAGRLTDYQLTLNDDGSVTVFHPRFGTDTLFSIEGLWFHGEQQWYSIEDALAIAGDVDGTVDANGVVVGNNQDNVLTGTNGDDVFYGGRGDDVMDGGSGGYDQVDYDGALADYTLSRNADGTVTVSHAEYGTDTLTGIDGLWFGGEARWYSLDDAIAASGGNSGGANVDAFGVQNGTDRADTLTYTADTTALYGGRGNDTLIGVADQYSQANYDGKSTDYTWTRNTDGTVTVTHPRWGTDTLVDIDGVWFTGQQAWMDIETLLGESEPVDPVQPPEPVDPETGTGRLVDGVITGSNSVDDLLIGTDGVDTFSAGMGVDRIEGGAGRDVLNVDGDVIEWTFSRNADNEVVMTHPTWGENTLSNIELIFFGRSGEALSVSYAVAATQGLDGYRDPARRKRARGSGPAARACRSRNRHGHAGGRRHHGLQQCGRPADRNGRR